MSLELERGDRVRITPMNSVPGYWPGEKGTVIWGPNEAAGVIYYVVVMDHSPNCRPRASSSQGRSRPMPDPLRHRPVRAIHSTRGIIHA